MNVTNFSSNILTTAVILVMLQQSMNVVRIPVTLMATFAELSTIQTRARLLSRAERQKLERENAFKSKVTGTHQPEY